MSNDASNQIRDFRYDLSVMNHSIFLNIALDIGLLPQSAYSHIEACLDEKGLYGIDALLQGESLKTVSLVAHNTEHRRFVWYGLCIGLFPSTFLDYLKYDLEAGDDFSSEDTNSVKLLLQGVEQSLREAFDQEADVPRKKNFSQLMGEETVTIVVGEKEYAKKFVIHKDLLMNKVVFFEKMFNSRFLESSTGMATLPEDSPEAFEVLVEWVYCSTMKPLHKDENPDLYRADLAIATIGLAEKYLLPELGDRAMTFLSDIGKDLVPTMSQMNTLYEQTPLDSKARIYAARTVAWALVNPDASEISNSSIQTACQHSDLLLDTITEVRGKNGSNHGRAHTYPTCDYHNHAKAPTCPYGGGQVQTAKQQTPSYQRSTKKRGGY